MYEIGIGPCPSRPKPFVGDARKRAYSPPEYRVTFVDSGSVIPSVLSCTE